MALDESLLQRAAEGGPATLRLYEWSEPTLSLGYFQDYVERNTHEPSRDCAVVRRATGGGAILHDRELTYSIALPSSHRLSRRAGDLYRAVHESIIAVLSELGVEARLSKCQPECIRDDVPIDTAIVGCGMPKSDSLDPLAKPFLCFARRCPGDVLIGNTKVAGSAQRRRRGAVLQHGSILLECSPYAPELPGINDMVSRRIYIDEVAARFCQDLEMRAEFDLMTERPSAKVDAQAVAIERARFAAEQWTRLR
jgi:lipoate-protein ligase A